MMSYSMVGIHSMIVAVIVADTIIVVEVSDPKALMALMKKPSCLARTAYPQTEPEPAPALEPAPAPEPAPALEPEPEPEPEPVLAPDSVPDSEAEPDSVADSVEIVLLSRLR